jgi:hypothetical protein
MNMDSPGYTAQSLERLSTNELITLAEIHGLDIPQDLERVFIIEELLYLERGGIGKAGEPDELSLPKQHNISIIEVLVRDPLWAFVFWEIKGNEPYVNHADFEGYCLRVIPLKEDSDQPDMAGSFFIPVEKNDSARYIGFPPDDRRFFKVELCVPRLENYNVLAVSQPFRMPRLVEPLRNGDGELQAIYHNSLAKFSGVEHFPLLRNMDRTLRPRES